MHLNSRVGSFCRFLSTEKYTIKLTLLFVSRCFQLETCAQQDVQSNFPQDIPLLKASIDKAL